MEVFEESDDTTATKKLLVKFLESKDLFERKCVVCEHKWTGDSESKCTKCNGFDQDFFGKEPLPKEPKDLKAPTIPANNNGSFGAFGSFGSGFSLEDHQLREAIETSKREYEAELKAIEIRENYEMFLRNKNTRKDKEAYENTLQIMMEYEDFDEE